MTPAAGNLYLLKCFTEARICEVFWVSRIAFLELGYGVLEEYFANVSWESFGILVWRVGV